MKRTYTALSVLLIVAFLSVSCSLSSAVSSLGSKAQVGQTSIPAYNPTLAPSGSSSLSTIVPSNPVTGNPAVSSAMAALEGTLEQVYTQVNPSVVNIQVATTAVIGGQQGGNSPFGSPFGFGGNGNQGQDNQVPSSQALGSGFVWDDQGHIVTNNHVIDGATQVSVTFADGFTVPAKVVGADPNSDLAVVQVEAGKDRLHPVALAESGSLRVGQLAIAIGNPFGLSGTMTMGIISAVGRSLPSDANITGGSYTIPNIIQTDAPINPGNSGGVLLNELGQVVGVTNAIESPSGSNAGIGFAIPSAIVKKIIPALIEKGSYQYSWLGISGTSLTYELNQAMGLKSDQRGALVAEVTSGSPGDQAGLKGSSRQSTVNGSPVQIGGDVITAIDQQPVNTFNDLVGYLVLNTQPGQKVNLTVLRNGTQQQITVTLAARPSQTAQQSSTQQANPFGFGQGTPGGQNNQGNQGGQTNPAGVYLGIAGLALTPEINQAAGLNSTQQGILVERVQQNSPASKAGVQASTKSVDVNGAQVGVGGDVITAIDKTAVASVQDLQAALQQYQPGQKATLTVLRNGQQTQVTVTLEMRPGSIQ